MYKEYFGFEKSPFSIAPDPRFLYMSERHREALAHLLYGMQTDGGFVLVSGEVGTGKTTMCRCLLEQLPENVDLAFILNPRVTTSELLATICDEFRIRYPQGTRSIKKFVDLITAFLLETHAKGRRTVLIIDEAQNLHPTVLEQVRLLTNLETSERKLLQIIMLGQPELLSMLDQPELRQLAQRITARYHLGPLSRKELGHYVNHRLTVAGLRQELFPPSIIRRLYRMGSGIPRLTNVICDRALLGAYVQGHTVVKRRTLTKAAKEVLGGKEKDGQRRNFSPWWAMALLVLLVAGFVFATDFYQQKRMAAPIPEKAASTVVLPAAKSSVQEIVSATVPSAAAFIWPAELPVSSSKIEAFKALLASWGLAYSFEEHGDICPYAAAYGLQCLFRRGSLGSLRQFNRPAVLRLFDDQGQDFFAALLQLKDGMATVFFGLSEREMTVSDLQDHWLGDFTLIWRPPSGYEDELEEGDRGPAVQWLAEQLARGQGWQLPDDGYAVFDAALTRKVIAFQSSQGLPADGIVGPQTVMRFNTLEEGQVGPLLTPPRQGG